MFQLFMVPSLLISGSLTSAECRKERPALKGQHPSATTYASFTTVRQEHLTSHVSPIYQIPRNDSTIYSKSGIRDCLSQPGRYNGAMSFVLKSPNNLGKIMIIIVSVTQGSPIISTASNRVMLMMNGQRDKVVAVQLKSSYLNRTVSFVKARAKESLGQRVLDH